MITLKNLNYYIKEGNSDRAIINNFTHTFPDNILTTITGPSGSGKTTLLYAMAGLLDITDGEVIIGDTSIYKLPGAARDEFRLNNIGVIYQNFNLLTFMNVRDNVLLPLYMRKTPIDSQIETDLKNYLDELHLGDIQGKSVSMLSGGEQQRVSIIRSLICKPKIILCDEPTGNLDRKNSIAFMEILSKLKSTIVVVTHDELIYGYGEHKVSVVDGQAQTDSQHGGS